MHAVSEVLDDRDLDLVEAPPFVLVRVFRANPDGKNLTYLADGLSEDLITHLSRQSDISVLSYTASQALSTRAPPPELNVTRIVDGSIRDLGGAFRITAAVLDANAQQQLWAERFDIAKDSLLSGLDQVCGRIADALAPGRLHSPAARIGTSVPAAYEMYLRGRHAYYRYEPAAFAQALASFEQAAALDPDFAEAFAQQAYGRTTLYVFGVAGSDRTLDRAEALARRAIALNATSALGHARLGWVLGYTGRADETVAAFEAALVRDEQNSEVLLAYGETMNRLAEPRRADQLLTRAFGAEAFHPPSWDFARGHSAVLRRDYDTAIRHFTAVLERVGGFVPAAVQLARAYWETGDPDAARQTRALIGRIAPKYSLGHAVRMFPYPSTKERARLSDALQGSGLA